MSHYEITRWTDYVRGLGEAGERAPMERHLYAGCARCGRVVGALRHVARVTGAQAAASPPAGAVRSVRAAFAVNRPEARSAWRELSLRQIFDSALAPAQASRCDPSVANRQLLFESDEYTLELSVDRSSDVEEAVLRGQLLEARGEPRSHTPVFLVAGGELLGRTISEDQGTFEMTGRLDRHCELWVFPDDEHHIKLRLDPDH